MTKFLTLPKRPLRAPVIIYCPLPDVNCLLLRTTPYRRLNNAGILHKEGSRNLQSALLLCYFYIRKQAIKTQNAERRALNAEGRKENDGM
jgi:hypothetical protein